MENLFGKITASLIDNDLTFPLELVDIINSNISPPEKVTADGIYIRAMYIVSDEVNSYGGRFPNDEFETLMSLIIDSPVLIGHRKDSLPIARNFHTEQVQKGDSNWIKVYFYWLKNAKGAETLKNNIDGGIYKECSISFVFSLPECSICGDDIRRCGHRPFKEYQTKEGEKSAAHFNYRQIERVLETSIVYRGSVHDTSLTNELFFPEGKQQETETKIETFVPLTINRIWDTEQLDTAGQCIIKPAYESIRIIIERSKKETISRNCDGTVLSSKNLDNYLSKLSWPDGKYSLDCRLIGYRGKERQKLSELSKYLGGRKSKVTRIELKVSDLLFSEGLSNGLPDISKRLIILQSMSGAIPDMLMSSEAATHANLSDVIAKYSTRYGVEITDCQTDEIFLLSNNKRALFKIISKEQMSGGYKYSLSGIIGDVDIECTAPVTSGKSFAIGQSIEIEMSSIKLTDNRIELVFPKITDSTNQITASENLELLIIDNSSTKPYSTYSVSQYSDDDLLLTVETNKNKQLYIINNFSLRRLAEKRRFVTEEVNAIKSQPGTQLGRGQVLQGDCTETSGKIKLNGYLNGLFVIRPIILNHTNRFLFYQINEAPTSEANSVSV